MIHINRTANHARNTSQGEVLVDDILSGSEARDILFALLDSTINFNKLQNLRSQIQTQSSEPCAEERRNELEATRSNLREILLEADRQGLQVRVHSTFEIEVEPEDPFPADGTSRLS